MIDPNELFENDNPIFANKDLLRVEHLPKGDKIIGRDEQIQSLANALRQAVHGRTPNNALVYGKTGTGKSLCTKYVTKNIVPQAKSNGVSVGVSYIDCLQEDSETDLISSIAREFNSPDTGITVPLKGISTSQYYQKLWDILDHSYDVGIIVLDEIDKIGDEDSEKALMLLSRAVEAGKISDCKLGIIGISNDIRYKEKADERLKSSLGEQEFVFPPYDADQLREILKSRREAFADSALSDDAIPKAAAFAAKEHGDARKAIDILRFAGEKAEAEEASMVTDAHIDEARDRQEEARLAELISCQVDHSQYLLIALAMKTKESGHTDGEVPTKKLYEFYKTICDREGTDPLKIRRVRGLLDELDFLSLINQDYKSRGRGRGGHMVNTLLDDPDLVLSACDLTNSQ